MSDQRKERPNEIRLNQNDRKKVTYFIFKHVFFTCELKQCCLHHFSLILPFFMSVKYCFTVSKVAAWYII